MQISGRVIVIGDDVSNRDRHRLYDRDVSGAYLQANYIESLLDERYLRPLGASWNFTIFAVWLIFLYLIFWIQPEVALILSVAVGFFAKYLIKNFVMQTGLYPDLWVQHLGAIALLLKYIESRGHLLIESLKHRRATHSG